MGLLVSNVYFFEISIFVSVWLTLIEMKVFDKMYIKSSTLTKHWGVVDLFVLDLLFLRSLYRYAHET